MPLPYVCMVKSFELIKNQCDFISLQNRHSLIHHDHREYNTKNSKNQNNIKEFIKIIFHRKKVSDFFAPVKDFFQKLFSSSVASSEWSSLKPRSQTVIPQELQAVKVSPLQQTIDSIKMDFLLFFLQKTRSSFSMFKRYQLFPACQRFFLIFCQYPSVADLFLRQPQPPLWHRASVSKSPLANAAGSYRLK